MYLWFDEVVWVLEKVGFIVDVVMNKMYGYWCGENYVYVNCEVCMGCIVLIIYFRLKDCSLLLVDLVLDIKICDYY